MKLVKLSLESMRFTMPMLADEFFLNILGGYDNDCFWRCIAYSCSGGTSFSESYADSFFGPEAGLYYNGAHVSNGQMKEFIGSYFTDESQFTIVQLDPRKAGLNYVSGISHVVIFKEDITENGVGKYVVFDPQHNKTYKIPFESVMDNIGPSGNGSGSGSYGSSDIGSYGSSGSYGGSYSYY